MTADFTGDCLSRCIHVERTLEEFDDLFAAASLRLDRVVETTGGVAVLEASPA
jgi:hypothetical protein